MKLPIKLDSKESARFVEEKLELLYFRLERVKAAIKALERLDGVRKKAA